MPCADELAACEWALTASAVAAVYVSRINPWLAIPVLYLYWFFYGFWVAIGHELHH